MCFSDSNKSKGKGVKENPIAYRIHRAGNDERAPGVHERRRSSVERHLANAPPVNPGYGGHRYPHKYNNRDRDDQGRKMFPDDRGQLYEYLTKDFPYGAINSKGRYTPTYTGPIVPKGSTRTITTEDGEIVAVGYHPYDSDTRMVRAEEIHRTRGSRR